MDELAPRLSNYARDFVHAQIAALDRFDYIALSSPEAPFLAMEILRTHHGQLEVRVPPRMPATPLPPAKRAQLVDSGFHCDEPANPLSPWQHPAADPDDAIDLVIKTMKEVFEVAIGDDFNLLHGSHRDEYEAAKTIAELRGRIEPVLADMLGTPPKQDPEGDYLFPVDHIDVIIAPRVLPGAMALVRVFAVTNAGVSVTPELGLFLARLNFGMMFGRFALDTEHHAIWVDDTLPGDTFTDEQLRFMVNIVAHTATEWTSRIKHMFGGTTHQDIEQAQHEATPKPGTSGYL